MTNKVLTIVVPTYNMEKYLDRCLSSLIVDDQLMELLEVLVINDGSKDRSSEIAHTYESRYPQTFKVIDKQNGNYGSCINAALPLARGTYFRILDADDWFDQNDFIFLLSSLVSLDVDLLFTDYRECHHENQDVLLRRMPIGMEPGVVFSPQEFAPYIQDCHFQMHGMTYKSSVLLESGLKLQEGISYTDTEYSFFPLPFVNKIARLDIAPYCYLADRPDQTMSKASLMKCLPQLKQIAERLVVSFASREKQIEGAVKKMWLAIINRVLGVYYSVVLIDSKKNAELDRQLVEMDTFLSDYPFFYESSDELKLNKVRYVHVWRKSGIYNSSVFFQLHNSAWKMIKYFVDIKNVIAHKR